MSFVRQPHQHFKTGNTAVFSSVAGKHKDQLSNKIIALVISQGHILHDPNIPIKLPCLEKGKYFSFFFFFKPKCMFEEACGSEQVTVSGLLVAPEKLHAGSSLHGGSSFSVSQLDVSVSRCGS